ncbi:MAG: hypothetical protein D6693_02450 [Planctomycetota bacterium]|nr:MAG: hypothetical protein D6693_02450 [Planctomycetota bacterium]
MKRSGIPFIEVIADKLFLGLFLVVLLGVIAMQFLGSGVTVRAGNTDMRPDRAYEEVARLAQTKRAQLDSATVPEEIPTEPPRVVDRLASAIGSRGPDPGPSLPLGPVVAIAGGAGVTDAPGLEALRLRPPDLPAPGAPVGQATGVTLDPFELQRVPALRAAVLGDPSDQPLDAFLVSVQAEFDAAALRDALDRDPDGAGPMNAIPTRWWRNRLEILDVRVERREILADGDRGPSTLLPPAPGTATVRDLLGQDLTPAALNRLVERVGQPASAAQIRQPRFYRAIAGEPWRPPLDAQPGSGDPRADRLEQILSQIEDLQRELDRLQEQALVPGAHAPAVAQVSRPGGGGGRSRPAPPGRDDRARTGRETRIEALQTQITELRAQADQIEQELIDAGLDPRTGRPALGEAAARAVESLRDAESISVWTHDASIRPGARYEYRVSLVLPNPLFGYDESLDEGSRAYAEAPTITTPASPWSAPVLAPARSYIFVENASVPQPGSAIGDAGATVTRYRFFYGYWREARTRVRVGDVIAPAIELPAPLPVWDVSVVPPAVQGEITRPIAEDPPGLFLLDVFLEPSLDQAGVSRAEDLTPAVRLGRISDGAVIVRRPRVDRADPLLARLRASARAGQSTAVRTPSPSAQSGPAPQPESPAGPGPESRTPNRGARPPTGAGSGRIGG